MEISIQHLKTSIENLMLLEAFGWRFLFKI